MRLSPWDRRLVPHTWPPPQSWRRLSYSRLKPWPVNWRRPGRLDRIARALNQVYVPPIRTWTDSGRSGAPGSVSWAMINRLATATQLRPWTANPVSPP